MAGPPWPVTKTLRQVANIFSGYDVVLVFENSTAETTEPDEEETVPVSLCFTVLKNTPVARDAYFDINILASSNASIDLDFYLDTPSPLIIEAAVNGGYEACIEFVVIGDNVTVEGTEVILVDVVPRSSRDEAVYLPQGSSSSLQVIILDNIGKLTSR